MPIFNNLSVNEINGGPAHYVEVGLDEFNSIQCIGASLPDFSGATSIGDCVFFTAWQSSYLYPNRLPPNTTIDLSNITSYGKYSMGLAFDNNTNLVGKIVIADSSVYGSGLQYAFRGTSITEVEIGQINPANNAMEGAFKDCLSLTKVTIKGTRIAAGTAYFNSLFENCPISTLDVSSVVEISGTSSSTGHTRMFGGLTQLSEIAWYGLNKINRNALNGMFYGSTIGDMYFPSVTSSSFIHTASLNYMFDGVTGCTAHFPSNVQATVEAQTGYSTQFGGTNCTVLFDLPATVTLTGADTKNYERNPKYDTSTALAWYDTSATIETPYYTSGTTDPVVGDTIYSDSACTTAVTTISSIA